jgi:hypothetical protein
LNRRERRGGDGWESANETRIDAKNETKRWSKKSGRKINGRKMMSKNSLDAEYAKEERGVAVPRGEPEKD